jgi:hypothetical protein
MVKKKGYYFVNFSEKRKSALVRAVRSIWKRNLDFNNQRRNLKNRARWRKTFNTCLFFLKGLMLICVIYLYHYLKIQKFFLGVVSSILKKIFKVSNFLPFLNFRGSFIFRFLRFLKFLKIFDDFWFFYFNFFVFFVKFGSSLVRELVIKKRKFRFFFGIFEILLRHFILLEIYSKVIFLGLFRFDFFSYLDNLSRNCQYVMAYNDFIFRLSIFCFLFFFKDAESMRMLKYNEYLVNSFLFCNYLHLRLLFIRRFVSKRENLFVSHIYYFKYAVYTLRFLLFEVNSKLEVAHFTFSNNIISVYKLNSFLNFLLNILHSRFVIRWFSIIFEGYLVFYLMIDVFKAVMRRLRLLYVFKWYLYNFLDAARKMYDFRVDMYHIFFFLKNKMEIKLSSSFFKSSEVINYYFFRDLVYSKFTLGPFFFFNLLDIVFWDFNEYVIISTLGNVEENQSYFFNLFRHFDFYSEKLVFLFFELSGLVNYEKFFFFLEYFYWKILNIDFTWKFGLPGYFTTPVFDLLSYSRFLHGGYFVQKVFSKGINMDVSIFLVYYMFLLYRDIIFKSIYYSFDLNLLFFFFFKKKFIFRFSEFCHVLKLNYDNKLVLDYLSKQTDVYFTSRWIRIV